MVQKYEEYFKSINALGIRVDRDPFPIEAPSEVDYWADNKNVHSQLIQLEIDSVMFLSTSLYVFWGPVGVGKTFAAAYLANPRTKDLILKRLNRPQEFMPLVFTVNAVAPFRTGQLTFSVYRATVKTLFSEISKDQGSIKELAKAFRGLEAGTIRSAFRDIAKRITYAVTGEVVITNIEKCEGFKLLVQQRSKLGKLLDINDLVTVVKTLVDVLSNKYRRIMIVIDELENLSRATGTERLLFSDLLRRMHDEIDLGVTFVLIFTFDSYEEVASTLQPALVSRVRKVIEFGFVESLADIQEYIIDCLRYRSGKKLEEIMDRQVLEKIAGTLQSKFGGRLSFRDINKEMHEIFTTAYMLADQPDHFRLSREVYRKAMKVSAESISDELRKAEVR